jgi:hypothetical protein
MKVLTEIVPKTIENIVNNIKKETKVMDFLYRDTLFSMDNERILRKRGSDGIIEKIKEILGLKKGTEEAREETKGEAYEEALRKARKVMDELDENSIQNQEWRSRNDNK